MNNKMLTLLGFASKAGRLAYGQAASLEAMQRQKTKLLVIASDVSEKSQKELKFHAEKNNTQYLVLQEIGIAELSNAVGRSCGAVSVNDGSFADAIKNIG